jgi:hypothetical protein
MVRGSARMAVWGFSRDRKWFWIGISAAELKASSEVNSEQMYLILSIYSALARMNPGMGMKVSLIVKILSLSSS